MLSDRERHDQSEGLRWSFENVTSLQNSIKSLTKQGLCWKHTERIYMQVKLERVKNELIINIWSGLGVCSVNLECNSAVSTGSRKCCPEHFLQGRVAGALGQLEGHVVGSTGGEISPHHFTQVKWRIVGLCRASGAINSQAFALQ